MNAHAGEGTLDSREIAEALADRGSVLVGRLVFAAGAQFRFLTGDIRACSINGLGFGWPAQIPQGLKRLRKKFESQVRVAKSIPQGLKPGFILLALCGMAEPMP
jgi:hypothetical protein